MDDQFFPMIGFAVRSSSQLTKSRYLVSRKV